MPSYKFGGTSDAFVEDRNTLARMPSQPLTVVDGLTLTPATGLKDASGVDTVSISTDADGFWAFYCDSRTVYLDVTDSRGVRRWGPYISADYVAALPSILSSLPTADSVVTVTGDQSISGTKTFASLVVPEAAIPLNAVDGLQAALNGAKSNPLDSVTYMVEATSVVPPAAGIDDILAVPVAPTITYLHQFPFETTLADGDPWTAAASGLTSPSTATVVKPGLVGTPTNSGALRTSGTGIVLPYRDLTGYTALRISWTALYVSLPANVTTRIMRLRNVTAALDGPVLGLQNGRFALYNGGTPVPMPTPNTRGPVSGEKWHHELNVDVAAGTAVLRLWYPDNPTIRPSETLRVSGVTWSIASMTRLLFGINNAQTAGANIVWDNLRVSESSQPRHPVTT